MKNKKLAIIAIALVVMANGTIRARGLSAQEIERIKQETIKKLNIESMSPDEELACGAILCLKTPPGVRVNECSKYLAAIPRRDKEDFFRKCRAVNESTQENRDEINRLIERLKQSQGDKENEN